MHGRLRPYLPELTIRDYNTYIRYLRGVRRQLYKDYGIYACHLLRYNGVLFAILSDGLAGRIPTCNRQRVPGTLCWRKTMSQTQGIRLAAQVEVLMGWHSLQDRSYSELRPFKRVMRAVDRLEEGEMDVKTIRDLTALVKELNQLMKNAGEDAGESLVRVQWSEEAQAWSE